MNVAGDGDDPTSAFELGLRDGVLASVVGAGGDVEDPLAALVDDASEVVGLTGGNRAELEPSVAGVARQFDVHEIRRLIDDSHTVDELGASEHGLDPDEGCDGDRAGEHDHEHFAREESGPRSRARTGQDWTHCSPPELIIGAGTRRAIQRVRLASSGPAMARTRSRLLSPRHAARPNAAVDESHEHRKGHQQEARRQRKDDSV